MRRLVLLQRLGAIVALLAAACASHGCSEQMAAPEPADADPVGVAQMRFLFDDFGGLSFETLETNALPYKVVAAALLAAEERRSGRRPPMEDLPRLLARYGFLIPDRIGNWNGTHGAPRLDRPLGLVSGTVEAWPLPVRVEAFTLGCASCHAGNTWDAEGLPTREAWLGLPNSSLDLEAFSNDLFAALRTELEDPAGFRRAIEEMFPAMGRAERWTVTRLLRRARQRVAQLDRTLGGPSPFSNGGPGRTNGVAALKLQLGLLATDRREPGERGFTSIPDLGGRTLRSSLLYDGFYALKGMPHFAPRQRGDETEQGRGLASIVAFFTVPTMGVEPAVAEKAIPRIAEVMTWLNDYTPPPFPGQVDRPLAGTGQGVYAEHCARCHGRYDASLDRPRLLDFPNLPIPQDEMSTDPVRWQVADERLAAALRRSAFARHVSIRPGRGYVAPLLSGVWATAPYLHNGSVPTLWHLLNPELRPERFEVGGHRLDYDQVGIAGSLAADGAYRYPAGYSPWSEPELYDTREPGLSNRGHEAELTGLDAARKRALLEYLKLL